MTPEEAVAYLQQMIDDYIHDGSCSTQCRCCSRAHNHDACDCDAAEKLGNIIVLLRTGNGS